MTPTKQLESPDDTPGEQAVRRAWQGRAIAASAIAAALAVGAAYWLHDARHWVSTEDAYVEGNVVQVTPQVGGVVTAILADNTDLVGSGQTLVELNGVDAKLALVAAQAQLARTVRQVRGQFAAAGQDRANVELRAAELAKVQQDMSRRATLAASGAISGEEMVHATHAVRTAKAALAMATEQLKRNHAMVERTSVQSHPDVQAAATAVRNASIALSRTRIPAPVGGVVTKRSIQVGQRVNAGVPMMSVVPLNHLWVTANLKESQLRDIRLGQPVTLTSDLYGRGVVYQGRVIGQDAGTGSAFALLPAQNATGNWIKIVQRVPVRIALDPAEVAAHPLQVGLSMKVSVDTRERDGRRLVAVGAASQNYRTTVFADELARVDEMVRHIVEANL